MSSILNPQGPRVKPAPVERTRRGGQRPFAAIPHDLVADRRLIPTDIRLACVLLKFGKGKPSCWPGVDTLAAEMGTCRRTVQYALKRLMAAGWVASRPAGNPTGRVLVMTWREAVAPPGVQDPYSQGLPRKGGVPGKPVAPEGMGIEGKGTAPPPDRGRGPADTRRVAPERPLSADQVMAQYAECGWLSLPASNPLRRLAERRIAAVMGAGGWGNCSRTGNRRRPSTLRACLEKVT